MKKRKSYAQTFASFKKWTRKKYSVFNSLRIVIKICTLLLVYTIVTGKTQVSAQTDTILINDNVELEEIEVVGQRAPGVYSDVSRVVTLITKEDIEAASVQSLNDLFEFIPNIDIRQRGTFGVQADITTRGGSSDQTLILLNGIPVNDPQTGHHNLNLPVELNNIKKIEILQGPGSRIYGANAFSGAINIITNDGSENSLNLSASVGGHKLYQTGLSVSKSYKNSFINYSFSKKSSSGYTDNTDFNNYNMFLRGGFVYATGRFDVQVGYLNKAFGANSFYSAKFPEQFEQVKTKFASLAFSTGKNVRTELKISLRRHHDRFELFREDRYSYSNGFFIKVSDTAKFNPSVYTKSNYYGSHNYHLTNIFLVNHNTSFKWKLGTSSIGSEFKMEDIFSNVLGNKLTSPIDVTGERGVFTKRAKREYVNFFGEHIFKFKKIIISGGAMGSYTNDYGIHFYAGSEISRETGTGGKLFASVNQSLRLPTFTDLYYSGPTNVGNPDLRPEKALTIETGHRKRLLNFYYQVDVFYSFGRDIIDWVKFPDEEVYTTRNYTSLNTYGLELYSNVHFNKNHSISRYVRTISFSYCYLETEKKSDDIISVYALDYLKHKMTFKLIHNLYKSLNIHWDLTYQDRNGTYTDLNMAEKKYHPFLLINSKLNWKQKFYEIYIESYNITNGTFRDFGSIPQPGRWFIAGINFSLSI